MRLDANKINGLDLPTEDQWVPAEDVLSGTHNPRGAVLYYSDQIVVSVYEDGPAKYRFNEPFPFDEFVRVESGQVIVSDAAGESEEFSAGDCFVLPKGWTGTWEMRGDYRELIVIERNAYEAAFGPLE